MTHHDAPMLFPTREEALNYCDDGEHPIPLYTHSSPEAAQAGLSELRRLIENEYIGYSGEHMDAGAAETIARAILTRASAATVADPSNGQFMPELLTDGPAAIAPEKRAAWRDGWNSARTAVLNHQATQQQAEPKHSAAKAGQHCVNCGLTLGQQTSWCNCEANRAVEVQQAEPECDTCEADGVYDVNGEGPFDCYKCGKKARRAVGCGYTEPVQQAEPVGDERNGEFGVGSPGPNYKDLWRQCSTGMGKHYARAIELGFDGIGHAIEFAAQSIQRAGVAEGWRFYSADFSMNAANPANWGTVMLTRDDAGRKWWHALSDEEREKIDLVVSGRGTTFDAAMQAANEKAAMLAAAPTHGGEKK